MSPDAGLFGSPPPADLVAQARAYIAAASWTFAKTMPDNPHEYVVRQRAHAVSPERGAGHEALFVLIRDHHYVRRWHGRGYRTVSLDGHDYWLIQDGTIVNRKPTESAGWDDEPLTLW